MSADAGIFSQLLHNGNIAFPKWDTTLTLKQQPDGRYAIMIGGVELPIVGFSSFTAPSIPQEHIHDGRGQVFIRTGSLQPGTLGITLMFTKLEVINGQGQPVEEPNPYRREGLDL